MTFSSNTLTPGLPALLFLLLITSACETHQEDGGDHFHDVGAEADYPRGPHKGRLLEDGDFAVEITIFETGVPPEFRVFAYRDGTPVDPEAVDLSIELGRLDGRVDRFDFTPQDDFLRGDGVVLEPHSFDVIVSARAESKSHRWQYESYEGRTTIESAVAEAMGVATAIAGPATILETIELQGTVSVAPDAITEIRGRFAGQVLSLSRNTGDSVRQGELLARIQSNESLQTYSITAPVSGTIIERGASVGSLATDEPIYVIADTSRLVADLVVYTRDIEQMRPGLVVRLASLDNDANIESAIDRILPSIDPVSKTATARVSVANDEGRWRPGEFVRATVTVGTTEVDLAVRESGLQAFRDFTVVYAQVGSTYEVRMLDLGRRDGKWVEILDGLEPGTRYVTENSYLIKADIEKSGASHDH